MSPNTALVRPPSPRLGEGIVTHIERNPVDYELALKQWGSYVEAMADAGWEIIRVPSADDCPDGVFIEDTLVVYKNVAVISRPGADSRKPEVVGAEQAVQELGCSINRIRPPGTLDGGDVLKIGNTIYVGQRGPDQRGRPPSTAQHPDGPLGAGRRSRPCPTRSYISSRR
jgi:dimethylargininase